MTSYERVMNRIEGKPVDKIPNLNIVMTFASQYINVPYSKYVTDYKYLVEGSIKTAEAFGIDAVAAISDSWREAAGFGAKIIIPEDDVPFCREHLVTDLSQIKKLKPVDPLSSERMLDRVRAIELFKHEVKNSYPIIGWVEGALAEATDLRDLSLVMMDLIIEPEAMIEFFELIYIQQKAFAKVQIEAGADIIGIGNAAASLIGPKFYEKFCLEYDRRIIRDIQSMGAKAKLHICGNTEPILGLIAKTEADIFDVDHMVDFSKAVEIFKGTKTVANGNLDPVSVFLEQGPKQVKEATKKCIEIGDERTLISGGCEIPRATPHENMLAMNEALYVMKLDLATGMC